MNLRREDLLLSLRAVLGRPAESLLLVLGMALAVGATAAGLALAGRIAEQSRERLSSPRYREIVVATRQQAGDMETPARLRTATDVVLTADDLAARQVAPAVRYAYLANPTGFPLGELPIPEQVAKMALTDSPGRPAGAAEAGAAATAVQVIVIPTGSQVGTPIADGARAPVAAAGAHATQTPVPATAPGGDAQTLADRARESSATPGPTAAPGGGGAQLLAEGQRRSSAATGPTAAPGEGGAQLPAEGKRESRATPGPTAAPEGSAVQLLAEGQHASGATPGPATALGNGDAQLRFEKTGGLGQALLTTPDGPRPQRALLTGFQVSPEFFAAWNLTPAAGSLFTAADMARGAPILVLGAELGSTLFTDGQALDRQVLSLNRLFTITGVLAPSGTEMDRHAFAPAPGAAEGFKATGIRLPAHNTSLRFAVADPGRLEEARAQLAGHFAAAYGEDAVVIDTPRVEAAAAADRDRRLITVTLFLELAALAIAAVNMTNIFYSRARRRRREVGILKALGGSVGKVFAAFFAEALVVGAAGAAMGLGLALLLSRLTEQALGFGVRHAGLTLLGVAAAWLVVAAATVLPAATAARLPAADAIRYE